MYIALSINNYKAKSLFTNINKLQTYHLLFIINKLSMIQIKLFALINKQLRKTKSAISFLTILFIGLSLIVLIGNFYQFALINNYTLQNLLRTKKKFYKKVVLDIFKSILSLIKQM